MRKISANYIFDGLGRFYKNGILIIGDNGVVIDLIDTNGELREENKLEFYNGIITPGFVNTHCHLELSYLRGEIKEKTGLPSFIKDVVKLKKRIDKEIIKSIINADKKMQQEGIVAVGDISNTDISFEIKQKSKIKYHTFIELIGPDKYKIDKIVEQAKKLKERANYYNLSNNYVPHATYSVSSKLLEFITDDAYKTNSIISIHNQETESENAMFLKAKGNLLDSLISINTFYKNYQPSGFRSLPSTLINLPKCNKVLLVHNTFTSKQDIKWTNDYTKYAYWCFCTNANLYIENKLPQINLFVDEKICLGTDSLASNKELSILSEIKTINDNFPEIPLSVILKWASYNGAEALDLHGIFGSFEKGKKPSANLIENIDFANMKLTQNSSVKVLI